MPMRPIVNRLATLVCAGTVLVASTHARAADDDADQPDARTNGYTSAAGVVTDVSMKGSNALPLIALAFFSAVTVGFMFKNANRSEVD